MTTFSKEAVTTLLVSTLLGVAIGCSKHPNDETIAKDVQTKVAADPVAKDSAISVTAKDGKVMLKGTVKDPATRQRVEQIAREEPGATGVDDETAVQPEPVPAPEQAANMPAPAPAPPAEKPKPQPTIVPAGTALTVHGRPSFEFQDQPGRPNLFGYFGAACDGARKDGHTQGIKCHGHGGYG